jgi:hypothetical protein
MHPSIRSLVSSKDDIQLNMACVCYHFLPTWLVLVAYPIRCYWCLLRLIDHFIRGTKFNIQSSKSQCLFSWTHGGRKITSTKLPGFDFRVMEMFVVGPEDCLPYITEGEDTLCSSSSLTRRVSY